MRQAGLILALVLTALPMTAERQRAVRPAPFDVEFVRDVTYGAAGGTELKLDIVRPRGVARTPRPVVVFIHGGGWRQGDKASGIHYLTPLAERGFFGVTINYRLTDTATFPAQIEDVKCAIRFLRANAASLGIDPDRIAVWGTSAGAHLAAMLGTTADLEQWNVSGGWAGFSSRVQAVVDWFGPADLNTMGPQSLPCSTLNHDGAGSPEALLLGCSVPACRDLAAAASPVSYVTGDDAPTLLMHGTNDCTVPPAQSQELFDRLRAAGVDAQLVMLPGAGHGGAAFNASLNTVNAFLDSHLR